MIMRMKGKIKNFTRSKRLDTYNSSVRFMDEFEGVEEVSGI